ncbi:MAG: Sec-independent protein translocase protein TatB [Hyphomicrobiaceae bacterium]|nr:Sec-independent protein translocase protein TatB [Hyphomicrobiaceae bacterium]
MIDFTSSKLLILGLVALMVIGPKDLPALLRTIGKYVGLIKRHANDFRAQFEEAMRDSELAEIRKQVESATKEAETSMRAAETEIEKQLADAKAGTDPSAVLGDPFAEPARAADAPTLPASPAVPESLEPPPPAPAVAEAHTPAAATPAPEKSGA